MSYNKPWTKWVLVPLWIVHIILAFPMITFIAYLVLDYEGTYDVTPVAPVVWIVLFSVSLLLDIAEIVLYSYGELRSVFYISLQAFKCIIWTLYWIMALINLVKGTYYLAVFIVLCFILLTYYWGLVYGAIAILRYRKRRKVIFENTDNSEQILLQLGHDRSTSA